MGLGLGGFVDGIVLHQVLQWHHLLSNSQDDRVGVPTYPVDTVAGLEANTLWDGLFHIATWILVVAGLVLLWNRVVATRGPWSRPSLFGAALAGWGLFNLVEGAVNHHLLQVHHVRQVEDVGDVLVWDLGFLGLGAALLAVGLALHRHGQRRLRQARADGTAVPHRPDGAR